MQVSKISFNGVENIVPRAEKQKIAFQGDEIPADNEKNNAAKYMIGATLAGLAVLGVLGYKGHLGEGIQKFLGGAKKAAQKEGSNASDSAKKAEEAVRETATQAKKTEEEAVNITTAPAKKAEEAVRETAAQAKNVKETVNEAATQAQKTEEAVNITTAPAKKAKEAMNTNVGSPVEESPIQTVKPTTVVDEQAEIERQIKEYEMENFRNKLKIAQSNDRNAKWLERQHEIKEKEYSDFWNKDVINARDITPETFIQSIKNIKNGETIRIMTDEGTIKSYTGLEGGTILFKRGDENGNIVETYKVIFTDKDKNIAKCIKQNTNGGEDIEFIKISERGIVNLSAIEERGISEFANGIRNGFNTKIFNRYKQILLEYGFVEVDKTVKIGDETVHIVMEGLEHDVTADGKLLKKVFAQNGQVSYKDVTAEYINTANILALQEEALRKARIQQYNRQRILFA